MDWFILLLLIPIVVVPLVLLIGFAGCDLIFKLDRVDEPIPVPTGLTATALGIRRIALSWIDNTTNSIGVTISRRKLISGEVTTFSPAIPPGARPPTTHIDEGLHGALEEATVYEYQVSVTVADDASDLSDAVTVTTLAWTMAFEEGVSEAQGSNPGNFAGFCMVQRIPAAKLALGGPEVRLTLRGSTTANMQLDAITISQAKDQQDPLPPGTINPWDSSDANLPGGLTPVASNLLVPAGVSVQAEVAYPLDNTRDVIVAFDLGTPGNTRQQNGVTGANLYRKSNAHEAATSTRSQGFNTQANIVANIEKIEVAAPPP